jgi:hypothetical protein
MKRHDQGHLHPLLEQPETNLSRPESNPGCLRLTGENSGKELFEPLVQLLFGTNTYVHRNLRAPYLGIHLGSALTNTQ